MPATESKCPRLFAGLGAVLALGTVLLYWPVLHHGFITLDDNQYVTANAQVQAGLTWAGVKWAFQNIEASNWHPLTWLSHMLDCQLYGLNPRGHHLTNVFFHAANALLVFFLLRNTTGAVWRSAVVAAIFAWHPLRVESVAWVAERKDVLCAFFFLLSLVCYARGRSSVERRAPNGAPALAPQPSTLGYWLALFFFACALMSKPMAVTLPFVLLLLDVWPLGRIQNEKLKIKNWRALLLEKIPFFALSVAGCVVNLIAQKSGGATWSGEALPLDVRGANALVSCLRYVSKTFWPVDLAVIYPYPAHWPLALVAAALVFLSVWSGLVLLRRRQNPFLFFGWFYFLGTLVPVIGLVQAGPQAMADRYTYIPSLGLLVLVVWGAQELLMAVPRGRTFAGIIAVAVGGACCAVTAQQLKYWEDSVKLFAHTVAVTTDNYTANDYLAGALELAGRGDEALPFYAESVRLAPNFPIAQWGYGMALLKKSRAGEAAEHLAIAARLVPQDAAIQCYWGKALSDAGEFSAAETPLTEALRLKPDYLEAQVFAAVNLAMQKKFSSAIPHFAAAVKLQPANPEFHFNLGLALADNGQPDAAVVQFTEALRLKPDEVRFHYRLALALQAQIDFAGAAVHFRRTLQLTPDFSEARVALEAVLAAHPELK